MSPFEEHDATECHLGVSDLAVAGRKALVLTGLAGI